MYFINMTKKVLNIDVETTGKNSLKHGITQISGIIEIDDIVVEEFDFKLRPFKRDIIDKFAIDIQNRSIDEILSWPAPKSTYRKITKIFEKYIDKYDSSDKFYPCAYNISFDIDFLIQFFRKNNDEYFGSWIDLKIQLDPLAILRMLAFLGKIDLPDYKLETVANALDIPITPHDSLSDVRATMEIRKILEKLINVD